MLRFALFLVASAAILPLSWRSLRDLRTHGFYRFFAFELLLALILLNAPVWFLDPFSARQLAAWSLGAISIGLAIEGFRLLRIGLNPPRLALYDRLNRRCAEMFASGIVEETRGLLERYGSVKALDSLGYRQALCVLRESWPIEEAVAAAQQGHRNYAKRQLTWFRREPEVHWIAGFGDEPEVLRMAMELVQDNL